MNKQKIIKLVKAISETGLKEGVTVSTLQATQIKICEKGILKELDSKIVMPKLFDEWVKSFALDSRYSEHNKVILINALGSCVDNYESMFYFTNIPEGDVMARWLFEDLDNRTLTCVDAILNGYEVKE